MTTTDTRAALDAEISLAEAVACLASPDLMELAMKVWEAVKGDVDERVRPYQTPVTMETLLAPVGWAA